MLDMVDRNAVEYAADKAHERHQEIELLQRAADAGESLITIRDCARRISQLQLRTCDYYKEANLFFVKIKDDFRKNKEKIRPTPDEARAAGHYYRSLFDSTIGRQMLDKWDAEDAKTSKRMEAEHA